MPATRPSADLDVLRAPCIATVARRELRLVEDDVAKQAAEEIAPALLGQHGGGAARIEAKGARQRARQPIDRRALLRARGEVDAAQERGRSSLDPPNAVLMKPSSTASSEANWAANPAMRARCSGPRSVCRRSSSALLQALQQAGELAAERPGWPSGADIGRERHAPDLAAGLPVEVVEEFGEADDEVDLADEEVDRQLLPELLLEFADAPAHGEGVHLRARPHRGGSACPRRTRR